MSRRTIIRTKKTVNMSCGQVLMRGGLEYIAAMYRDGGRCRNRGAHKLLQGGNIIYFCVHHEDRVKEVAERLVLHTG